MKKNQFCIHIPRGCIKKMSRIMKMYLFLSMYFVYSVTATTFAQNERVTFSLKDVSVKLLFDEIQRQTDLQFIFNTEQTDLLGKLSLEAKDETVEEILNRVLKNTDLTYSFRGDIILIKKKETEVVQNVPQTKEVQIKGNVIDERKNSLPGVTVSIKGTNIGTATDVRGNYTITIPEQGDLILIFTFIGMETQEIKYSGKETINVVMKEDKIALDEVIATGYGNKNRSDFTGSATTVKQEQILQIAPRNVIDVLQVFDPSLRIVRNNEMGSDPNTLPEFYIRGQTGVAGVSELDRIQSTETGSLSRFAMENNPNLPVFILDGYEINLEKVYDMDPLRIASVTILKDAAATAIYGSRASNGVIVIESVAPQPGKLNVSYSFTGSLTVPDLSDYNLMNAEEKLRTEVLAGIFDWTDPNSHVSYSAKLNNVLKGVDTDWMAQPLQNEVNHAHNLYIDGGAEAFRFGASIGYTKNGGVMKSSYRNNVSTSLFIDYRFEKVQIRNNVSYDVNNSSNSPYGSFSDYSEQLPYLPIYEDNGKLVQTFPITYKGNPLYEATLGNFDRSNYNTITNNLSVDWYINTHLQFKTQFAISNNSTKSKTFKDPASTDYFSTETPFNKGELNISESKSFNWNVNSYLAFNTVINRNHINLSVGFNMRETKTSNVSSAYKGFPSAALHQIGHAYQIVTKPSGSDNKSRLAGIFVSANYTYNNTYLADASVRFDGSSEFGSNKRWAPFWSLGAGINIHNYEFMRQFEFIDNLKIRGTFGQTGQVNYPAYAARDSYSVMFDEWYSTGIGGLLTYLGNENLKWQKTNQTNIGFDIGLFKRLNITFSWYNRHTIDMITDVSVPSSSGFKSYKDNMGENQNRGYEISLNVILPKIGNFDFSVFTNLAHNEGKLLKLSQAMKDYNDQIDDFYNVRNAGYLTDNHAKPFLRYEEGGSLTSIYGMKSLGINPMDGQEVFVNRDGLFTSEWESAQQVIIGDTEPKAKGSFGVSVRYKRISLYTSFMYEFGAKAYNQTLQSHVENANIAEKNVDKRVLTDRWQKPGDVATLKDIADSKYSTLPTSRFVQDFNELKFNSISLSYDFNPELVRKVGISMLRVSASTNDLATFSSIKQERGTSYPYARTFNFTLNLNF